MKRVLAHFFCSINNPQEGWLKEWFIVEDTITKLSTIKAKVNCIDGVQRTFDYSFAEFEYTWKINLGELVLNKLVTFVE